MSPIAAVLLLAMLCPLLGGLPLIDGLVAIATGRRLSQTGTGNVSVSAAFYHGGTTIGVLAVLIEAGKGIAAVLLARTLLPNSSAWELFALLLLVLGRYAWGRGAGITNAAWGCILHDWRVGFMTALIGGVGFTLVRERQLGRALVLILYPSILWILEPHAVGRVLAAMTLSVALGLIYKYMPDDLTLPAAGARPQSRTVFRFFQGDRALHTLNDRLDPAIAGNKAAALAQLLAWGYPVPPGWVLPAGDDPAPLLAALEPDLDFPFIVRSSAPGEDSETAVAAGIYESIGNLTDRESLAAAILQCQQSYNRTNAVQYRRDREQTDAAMAVLVQRQICGVYSGVAFSRDPVDPLSEAVAIEALPGGADRVVSGRETPQQYRVSFAPAGGTEISGPDNIPASLLTQVACIARELEGRYHGIPQDVEWTFDGDNLWLLQTRPIGTLRPIWTRKIAAEVIPGFIRPLTWSLNRPLTCGVWGDLFRIVLGPARAADLDFSETATLHYSRAYFNATLLGQIFLRMGLPPESLEFLTQGAKFSKPPLASTLRNLPGLLRLLQRELQLERDFNQDDCLLFQPVLQRLGDLPPNPDRPCNPRESLAEIALLRERLQQATYYNILAPLSFALRQALLKTSDRELDFTIAPEVSSLRELAAIAVEARNLLPHDNRENLCHCPSLFATIAETADGDSILKQFDAWLARYGYLSEAATDIAVPRWLEHPGPVRELFAQYFCDVNLDSGVSSVVSTPPPQPQHPNERQGRWQGRRVQQRLLLKARVAEVYNRLIAHLRWQLVVLARDWCDRGFLAAPEDIFFLEWEEVCHLAGMEGPANQQALQEQLQERLQRRRARFAEDRSIERVPAVLYGDSPSATSLLNLATPRPQRSLQGIPASPGEVTGVVRVLQNLQGGADLHAGTILVVPYTDAGWAPLLARSGGIVAEVGGRLSHGAIVAREYGIPAVMDVTAATQLLSDGQTVRLDGRRGLIEILD
ncbi:MAG: glycerol-3-phosphate acyltransferase [Cyanobacteria bacterium J06641_5]